MLYNDAHVLTLELFALICVALLFCRCTRDRQTWVRFISGACLFCLFCSTTRAIVLFVLLNNSRMLYIVECDGRAWCPFQHCKLRAADAHYCPLLRPQAWRVRAHDRRLPRVRYFVCFAYKTHTNDWGWCEIQRACVLMVCSAYQFNRYLNHVEALSKQLERQPLPFPKLQITCVITNHVDVCIVFWRHLVQVSKQSPDTFLGAVCL